MQFLYSSSPAQEDKDAFQEQTTDNMGCTWASRTVIPVSGDSVPLFQVCYKSKSQYACLYCRHINLLTKYCTMPGCLHPTKAPTSVFICRKLSSSDLESGIVLMATISEVSRSTPLYTTPYAPLPDPYMQCNHPSATKQLCKTVKPSVRMISMMHMLRWSLFNLCFTSLSSHYLVPAEGRTSRRDHHPGLKTSKCMFLSL